MNEIMTYLKIGFAGLCSLATYTWGGLDAVLIILLILIALDYLTGLLAAKTTKSVSSETGHTGLFKKVVILCLVAVAHLIGQVLEMPDIRTFVIGFYLANEAISITENAGRMGVPLPKKLVDILKQLRSEDEEE